MVKDKVEICSIELSKFAGLQGIGEFPLYKRYNVLRDIIESTVAKEYWHFLAQPVENLGIITWYCIPYQEIPCHFADLAGEQRSKYRDIKEETISNYRQVIAELKYQQKTIECEYLEKALSSIDDQFIYCFDEKVVLAIWGMRPKITNNRESGEYSKDLFVKTISSPVYTVEFNAGEQGEIQGISTLLKQKDITIKLEEIPEVVAFGDINFIGWDEEPLNYIVAGNKTFHAIYSRASGQKFTNESEETTTSRKHHVTFTAGEHGEISGNSSIEIADGEPLSPTDIPQVKPKGGFDFKGWNQNPHGHQVTNDTEFIAQYERSGVVDSGKKGWLRRILDRLLAILEAFWNWLKRLWSNRFFKWLIGFLLFLLLLWIISMLFPDCSRISCNGNHTKGNIEGGRGYDGGTGSGNGGSERSGDRGTPNGRDGGSGRGSGGGNNGGDKGGNDGRTGNPPRGNDGDNEPGGGFEYLPKEPGEIYPIDSIDFGFSKDSISLIVPDRLNILLEGDATVPEFAQDFHKFYPSERYQIVYYDTLIKRIQIKIPIEERERIKIELPKKLSKYNLFIWDETLFESYTDLNDPALQDRNKSWYITTCQVRDAWNITLGSKEIVVAIVDDGFDLRHPEFKGKIVNPYNVWSKNDQVFYSEKRHGTHVAGIALANGNNGLGIAGIAPNCSFMPVQVADANGTMTITSVVDGILYAIYNGADVINVSLGMSFTDKAIFWNARNQDRLIHNHFKEEERLWDEVFKIADGHNTTIVLAAGNENILAGIDPMHRPSQAITVSAVDRANRPYSKSPFSNYGEYSTLSAPGVQIFSTYDNNSYIYLDGTSMAAPIVAGAVALIKSINSELSTCSIKSVLVSTGIAVSGDVGNLIQLGDALRAILNGQYSGGDCNDCDKIAREIDSLQNEIEKRLIKCPQYRMQLKKKNYEKN